MLRLHAPLSPIQEDANSTDEEDAHADDEVGVHFMLGTHSGDEAHSHAAAVFLRPPPKPEAYHNHHHVHQRLQGQENHLQHEEEEEDDESAWEALGQNGHNETEAVGPDGARLREAPQPKDYLWLSLLSCFCCCPLGTVAIWYSRKASKSNKTGDLVNAKKHSKKALGVSILALSCDVIVLVIVIIVRFGGIIFGDLKFSWE